MTTKTVKCEGCGAVLEYSFDEQSVLDAIIVHCPVCMKKCWIKLHMQFVKWRSAMSSPTVSPNISSVVGKPLFTAQKPWFAGQDLKDALTYANAVSAKPEAVMIDDKLLDKAFGIDETRKTPAPPPAKWQLPKKLKGFDGLRAELDDLQKQTDVIRTVLLDKGKQIRSLQTENEGLRNQLKIVFETIDIDKRAHEHMKSRVAVLEKRYPSLEPKLHRAFPEKPNYVEWVSEDEELLEDGYNGFPKSKERVVF